MQPIRLLGEEAPAPWRAAATSYLAQIAATC